MVSPTKVDPRIDICCFTTLVQTVSPTNVDPRTDNCCFTTRVQTVSATNVDPRKDICCFTTLVQTVSPTNVDPRTDICCFTTLVQTVSPTNVDPRTDICCFTTLVQTVSPTNVDPRTDICCFTTLVQTVSPTNVDPGTDTSGGRDMDVRGRGPRSNNVLDFIIEHSNLRFTRSTILDFTGKKLAVSFIAHELVDGQRPPYVHITSTRHHSRDRCSQAFPVFLALPLPCIILNKNLRTKNGGGLGMRLGRDRAKPYSTRDFTCALVSLPDLLVWERYYMCACIQH